MSTVMAVWDFNNVRTWVVILLAGLSVIGLADAVYLVVKTATGESVVCNVVDGCSTVLHSSWASVGGIKTAVYGLGYYGLLCVFAFGYAVWRDHLFLQLLAIIVTVGFGVTVFLVYLQFFVIGAVCEYCMVSAFVTTVMFGLVWQLLYQDGLHDNNTEPQQ